MKTRSMSFKFEKTIIWQKAMSLGEEINQLAASFPKKENYNLSSQIRRSADSIALNISEGSILQSNLEFRWFLGYSIRSLAEVLFVSTWRNLEIIFPKVILRENIVIVLT